jgi:predicted acylesterase/phospholipase RssA
MCDTKRAPVRRSLVLSTGGIYGAFQVGVVKRLVEEGREWDEFYGSSAGAMNASILSAFKSSRKAITELENVWVTCAESWNGPNLSVMTALCNFVCGKNSINTSDRMRDVLSTFPLDRAGTRPCFVATTDMTNNGASMVSQLFPVDCNNPMDTNRERNLNRLLATTCIPGLWSPVSWKSRVFADPFMVAPVPIPPKLKDPDIEYEVDIICAPGNAYSITNSDEKVTKIGTACLQFTLNNMCDDALEKAQILYGDCARMWAPEKRKNIKMLDFNADHHQIEALIKEGYEFARCSDEAGIPAKRIRPVIRDNIKSVSKRQTITAYCRECQSFQESRLSKKFGRGPRFKCVACNAKIHEDDADDGMHGTSYKRLS